MKGSQLRRAGGSLVELVTTSVPPAASSAPIGVGIDLFRWVRPIRAPSSSGDESPRSTFEDEDDGFWRLGIGLAWAKLRRREKMMREVESEGMEVLQDAEELAKVVVPETGLQRSASTSDLPSGATGLLRLVSFSDGDLLSNPSSLPSLGLVTDEILEIGGYDRVDQTPSDQKLSNSTSNSRRRDMHERGRRVADWREQVQPGAARRTSAPSFFDPSADDEDTRPFVIDSPMESHIAAPAASPPPDRPHVPISPPTVSLNSARTPTCRQDIKVLDTSTGVLAAIAQTEPLRLNRPPPPHVVLGTLYPAPMSLSSFIRPVSASSSAYSTDPYDPFALHIPLYSVASEQPLPPPPSTPR
ncbi:hypothetical protein JCM11251_006660 [Rhodosporidiobolus azoricus]